MMKMIMMQWEPVCYEMEWQQHSVLRDHSTALTIYSSSHISDGQPCWGGRIRTVNMIHLGGAVGSHTSQLYLTAGYKVFNENGYFYTIILWLAKTIKLFFLFPAIQLTVVFIGEFTTGFTIGFTTGLKNFRVETSVHNRVHNRITYSRLQITMYHNRAHNMIKNRPHNRVHKKRIHNRVHNMDKKQGSQVC